MLRIAGGRWKGLEGMGDDALRQLRPEAENTLASAAAYFAGEIKITLTGQRHGRVYRVPGTRNRTYTASAPGEPPAVLFGNLRNSIGAGDITWEGQTCSVEVGVGLGQPPAGGADPENSYARILEFGGVAGGRRILPRPYMEPTSLRVEPELDRRFQASIGS